MRVAVIQMSCISGNKKENLKKAERLITEACEKGAELIVLPELFNTGYCCDEDWNNAEEPNGELYEFLKCFTTKYHISIMAGFIEKSNIPGLVYNSVMFIDDDKEPQVYRKIYLWGPEKNRFIPGENLSVWHTDRVKTAAQICYEVGFPENARVLTFDGAEILCYCSAFGKARQYAWDLATRARALENGCYVIASNHSATEGEIHFCGHSRIVDPQGNIIAEATCDDEVVTADIDLSKIYSQRNEIPYLRDIRTSCLGEQYIRAEK